MYAISCNRRRDCFSILRPRRSESHLIAGLSGERGSSNVLQSLILDADLVILTEFESALDSRLPVQEHRFRFGGRDLLHDVMVVHASALVIEIPRHICGNVYHFLVQNIAI